MKITLNVSINTILKFVDKLQCKSKISMYLVSIIVPIKVNQNDLRNRITKCICINFEISYLYYIRKI